MEQIRQLVQEAVKTSFQVDKDIALQRTDAKYGDISTNIALQLSKQLGKGPHEIAEKIAQQLQGDPHIASAEVAGPGFVNIRLNSERLARMLEEASSQKHRFGSSQIGADKTILAEFPSPNMAKPFSVGHIRSALQGWAIYKLMDFMGYTVIRDNHLGDSGTPFGKWVVGFERYSSDEQLAEGGVYELARVYITITSDLKAEKERGEHQLADDVQEWLQKLEAGEEVAVRYSERFRKISLDHLHDIMERLHIKTDEELGESFYIERGQALVDELLEKGIARKNEGAVIVDLDDQGIDVPIMLRKANGSALYATTDLATIEYRQKRWQPEKVFIHTGQEQAFYFNQLKALSRKIGYNDNIVHLWHGIVDQLAEDGSRGKMSSRKGVVLLEELLDKAEEKARTLNGDGSETDVQAVALGAIKFADFKADRKTGMLFDWDSMFDVHGFSGPAVQYAAVRIKSILRKASQGSLNAVAGYDWQAEHELLLQLLLFPDLLQDLHDSYELHKLAHYLYGLAQAFNRYYEKNRVLDAEEPARTTRLWLLTITLEVMSTGLDILGIKVPEKM